MMKNSESSNENHPSVPSGKGLKVEKSITINAPPSEVYAFWRRLENLPRFMHHIEAITERDNRRSHWVVKSPTGRVHWDAEIIEDRPDEMISWRTLPDSDVDNAGSVWFTPTQNGGATVIKISLKYLPPAGKAGAMVARLFGRDADSEIEEDLNRLRDLMEKTNPLRM